MKKIVIFSIIGVVISALVFGGVAYFMIASKGGAEKEIHNYEAGEFSTNLSDTKHFFKGSITIGLSNKKELKILTKKNIALRDTILSVLIHQKSEDMVNEEGIEKIKAEIKKSVAKNLNVESIEKVYFTDYIVQ